MIARIVSVIGGLLVVATLLSFQPPVTMWIWRRFDTFPDLGAVRETARGSRLPWRSVAIGFAEGAYEKGRRAMEEPNLGRQARAFREAKRDAFLAYMALHGPLFLGWAGLVATGVAIARGRRREPIDLDRMLVKFDLSGVGRVGIVLPERELPSMGADVGPACKALQVEGEDLEVFELIRRTAIEHGPASVAVEREITRLPAAKAGPFREALLARAQTIEQLRAYRLVCNARLAPIVEARVNGGAKELPEIARVPFEEARLAAIEHGMASERVAEHVNALGPDIRDHVGDAITKHQADLMWLHAHRRRCEADPGSATRLGHALRALVGEGVPPALLELREELREMGDLTPLRERGLRILAAHPRHPASIGFHGSDPGGLIEHTVAVVRRGLEMIRAGVVKAPERKALVTALLFHDIGKIVSYQERHGRFEAVDGLHAQNGALVLGAMPELWAEHEGGGDE